MTSYNYVDSDINNNLVCCICRTPFINPTTTRTCSHTFCRDCIVHAISIAPQCPVDRSHLTWEDLVPADPVVRNLIEELLVECPERSSGCTHTCQRQLLGFHLKEECDYVRVPCDIDSCKELVLRKDLGKCVHGTAKHSGYDDHSKASKEDDSEGEPISCEHCSATFPASKQVTHDSSCPELVVPCSHAPNGCPWKGTRFSLSASHIPSCPYEAIKGFFPVNQARMHAITEENVLLKQRVEALEGVLRVMTRELHVVKEALGPWHRLEGQRAPTRQGRSQDVAAPEVQAADQLVTEITTSLSELNIASTAADQVDDIASYFPPVNQGPRPPPSANSVQNASYPENAADASPPQAHTPYRTPAYQHHPNYLYHHQPPSAPLPFNTTPIAPVNLSTTLEGSLNGLRESMVTLSNSIDSVARRNDIALNTETRMINEEILSLKAALHGLRMQVHTIMMDRNAQVTGRTSDTTRQGSLDGGGGVGIGGWAPPPSGPNLYYNRPGPSFPIPPTPASITKL